MKQNVIILAALLLIGGVANGQNSIPRVLNEIESNNLTLRSRASLAQTQALEAKVGNSLSDPQVEYVHSWGSPQELGKQGEFSATQSFDFPSAYAARNKLAKLKGVQFASEYALYRQDVLMEAQNLCLEIISLRQQRAMLDTRAGFAKNIAHAAKIMFEAGQVNVLESSEAVIQYLASANEVKMIDIEIADAIGRLRILNGGNDADFTDTEFPAMVGIIPFEDIAEVYYDTHPAMRSALAGHDAARQEVKAARSESLPKLSLGYKLDHGKGERFHGMAMGMSIPMFGNRNNVKRAKAQERYASFEAEDVRGKTEQQLRTLYAKIALLEESIHDYDLITENSKIYLDNLAKALEKGQISVTDYFSQYDGIKQFEQTRIGLLKDYCLIRAQIYSVML